MKDEEIWIMVGIFAVLALSKGWIDLPFSTSDLGIGASQCSTDYLNTITCGVSTKYPVDTNCRACYSFYIDTDRDILSTNKVSEIIRTGSDMTSSYNICDWKNVTGASCEKCGSSGWSQVGSEKKYENQFGDSSEQRFYCSYGRCDYCRGGCVTKYNGQYYDAQSGGDWVSITYYSQSCNSCEFEQATNCNSFISGDGANYYNIIAQTPQISIDKRRMVQNICGICSTAKSTGFSFTYKIGATFAAKPICSASTSSWSFCSGNNQNRTITNSDCSTRIESRGCVETGRIDINSLFGRIWNFLKSLFGG